VIIEAPGSSLACLSYQRRCNLRRDAETRERPLWVARCRSASGERRCQAEHRRRGVNYLNNRYHDPLLGSFLSVDPLVRQTMEPYIYGSANPTTLSDPNGLCTDPGCWDFLGVVLRELTGQAEPGTTEERQEEYNALMASSMEQRMELLGPASWSSRDQLYYQQLTFGPTYELPDAGSLLGEVWAHRRGLLQIATVGAGAVCIATTAGACFPVAVGLGGANLAQSVQDNAGSCRQQVVVDAALSFGPIGVGKAVAGVAEGAEQIVEGMGMVWSSGL